jgi:hypothetical protein
MDVLASTMHDFRPPAIVLTHNRPRSTKGQGLDMDLGLHMWDKGLSSEDAS